MGKLILQHWAGDVPEIVDLSRKNMSRYAMAVGADYRMLRGFLFNSSLSPPCQKLFMLDEEFDEYDTVVMVDSDMFATPQCRDIFLETGVGIPHEKAASRLAKICPGAFHPDTPFFGGAIYRLPLDLRRDLRARLPRAQLDLFNNRSMGEDEGIFHKLCALAGKRPEPLDDRWAWSSYLPSPETAHMIHVRTRAKAAHPRSGQPKMRFYEELKSRGVIE